MSNINTLASSIINAAIRFGKKRGFSAKQISDGYHTFDELYYHRMMLFRFICHARKEVAWKSWKHDDGTMFDDSFIVGVSTPKGQYTYHYKKKYFDLFEVQELSYAPKYDGHQPSDIDRIFEIL